MNETTDRKNMHQDAPPLVCARILIADGSAWDRALLCGFLRRAGHLVRTVGYGTEALEVAGTFRPQVPSSRACTPHPWCCGSPEPDSILQIALLRITRAAAVSQEQ